MIAVMLAPKVTNLGANRFFLVTKSMILQNSTKYTVLATRNACNHLFIHYNHVPQLKIQIAVVVEKISKNSGFQVAACRFHIYL